MKGMISLSKLCAVGVYICMKVANKSPSRRRRIRTYIRAFLYAKLRAKNHRPIRARDDVISRQCNFILFRRHIFGNFLYCALIPNFVCKGENSPAKRGDIVGRSHFSATLGFSSMNIHSSVASLAVISGIRCKVNFSKNSPSEIRHWLFDELFASLYCV